MSTYKPYRSKANKTLESILVRLNKESNIEQTRVEILKYKPKLRTRKDINNARLVLDRLMARTSKPGTLSTEVIAKEIDLDSI